MEVSMATPLDSKQVVSFEELLMSQWFNKKPSPDCLSRKEFSPRKSFWRW